MADIIWGKFVNGKLRTFGGGGFFCGDYFVFATPTTMIQRGYKEIVIPDYPGDESHLFQISWIEKDDRIEGVWNPLFLSRSRDFEYAESFRRFSSQRRDLVLLVNTRIADDQRLFDREMKRNEIHVVAYKKVLETVGKKRHLVMEEFLKYQTLYEAFEHFDLLECAKEFGYEYIAKEDVFVLPKYKANWREIRLRDVKDQFFDKTVFFQGISRLDALGCCLCSIDKTLAKASFEYVFDLFEMFIYNSIEITISCDEELLKGKKNVTADEIIGTSNREEIINLLVEKELKEKTSSFAKALDFLSELEMTKGLSEEDLSRTKEMSERRNLIVHSGDVITEKYRKVAADCGVERYQKSNQLDMNYNDLRSDLRVMWQVAKRIYLNVCERHSFLNTYIETDDMDR